MKKITAEEAKKALQRLSSIAYMNLEDTLLLDEYIYQTSKAPTLYDVVKAWEGNGYIVVPDGERIYFNRNGYEIEFKIKEIEYEYDGFITLELHKLINLTIRYLEAQGDK